MKFRVHGSGEPVLFVHGIPTSGYLWTYVVEILRDRFTCIVVDLPGFGESSLLPDGSLDPVRYAQELDILRERLSLPSWHVVGHDAGSTVAVHYATEFRERVNRLILCSPPVFPDFKIPWFFRLLRTRGVGDCLAPLVCWLLLPIAVRSKIRNHNPANEKIVRAFCHPFAGWHGPRRILHVLRWGQPAEVLGKTAAALGSIAAPTLILQGVADGAIPMDFAVRAEMIIPHCKMKVMNCGHFIPLDSPDLFCDHVETFLGQSLTSLAVPSSQ